MKANKMSVRILTVILTVALMFSLCALSVFAESSSAAAESTPVASGTAAGTSASTNADTEEGKDIVGTIVSLSILGVIVIAIAVFCIIKREKVGKFFRGLKSEAKKVVWLPWNQVRKSTIVVVIVVVIVSIVIGVLDIVFSRGIIALGNML